MTDTALDYLLLAYGLDPDTYEVNNNLGNAYTKKQLYDKAVEHYKKAVSAAPRDSVVRTNLARAYVSAGQLENARSVYQEVIKLDDKAWDAYFEGGQTCISLNDSAGAKAFLEALLSKNPSYSKAPQAQTMLDGISG